MPKEVWIALIAAVGSSIVTLLSARAARTTQRKLEELKDQSAERHARRDYEYEARKRLYAQCEPALFEAMECAENFQRRVLSLARSARRGSLSQDGSGWLDDDGYYFKSTAYYLLAPATSFKILHRRLTAIDLALAPQIKVQYDLLKLIFNSYTWDHDLSKVDPVLPYCPDDVQPGDREQRTADGPDPYRRQGLYMGIVDQIADAMIEESGSLSHCKSLGEFWVEFEDTATPLGSLSGEIRELFSKFHPAARPVLWRLLLAQYQLLGSLLKNRQAPSGNLYDPEQILPVLPEREVEELDWRSSVNDTEVDLIQKALDAGRTHMRGELRKISRKNSRTN